MISGKEVLIVEDDPLFRRVLKNLFQREGAQVRDAWDGLEALTLLREAIPDLLICELSMQVIDGIDFIEEVTLQYPMLPIIVISGSQSISDVATALRLGVRDYLVKPIEDMQTVKNSVNVVLRDAQNAIEDENDFSQAWFDFNHSEEASIQELQWHLDELIENPELAKQLLLGLMPPRHSQQGNWRLSYQNIQSANADLLFFDYAWLMDGRFVFYLLDTGSGGRYGVATSLMIRAIFSQFIREQSKTNQDLKHLSAMIETGIQHSKYARKMNISFGMYHTSFGVLDILVSGILFDLQSEIGVLRYKSNIHQNATKLQTPQFERIQVGENVTLMLNDYSKRIFKLKLESI